MALAIAYMEPDGTAVPDEVKVTTVQGGEAGIDAVYRGRHARAMRVVYQARRWRTLISMLVLGNIPWQD